MNNAFLQKPLFTKTCVYFFFFAINAQEKKRNCRHRINRFNFRWETFQHRESSVPLNIKCISNCDIKINVELKDRFFQKSNSLFFSWNQLTDSARAEMTFPKVVKLLLILAPSLSRVPLAPVDSALSDPAKSTNEILLTWKYWEQLDSANFK